MNELKELVSEKFGSIRIEIRDGEPWFVAKDVCKSLAIKNNRDVLRRLDDDEKGMGIFDTPGGRQALRTVNEHGLYNLVFKSRKKEAQEFKRWISHEVLPSTRKHGAYMTEDVLAKTLQDPNYMIGILKNLADEQAERKRLQFEAELNKPKIVFADAVAASDTSILVGELAKLLKQNGVDTGLRRLFAWLRNRGYLMKAGSSKNLPTQKSMNLGLMEIKERTIINPDGSIRITRTPKITGKGQVYFMKKFLTEVEDE